MRSLCTAFCAKGEREGGRERESERKRVIISNYCCWRREIKGMETHDAHFSVCAGFLDL
jgi:hypothetical protein